MSLVTLKRRQEFLRIRGGVRWSSATLLLEGKFRPPTGVDTKARTLQAERKPGGVEGGATKPGAQDTGLDALPADGPARFGFTVTKKLGSAVVRNRIRRKLREIVRELSNERALPACDYVIVARDAALRCPSGRLRSDLETALQHVNRKLTASRR